MMLRWVADQALADAEMIAALYEVSTRTVRRYCRPEKHQPRTGLPPGEGGRALYNVVACAAALDGIAPRPERTLAAMRYRAARERLNPDPPTEGLPVA